MEAQLVGSACAHHLQSPPKGWLDREGQGTKGAQKQHCASQTAPKCSPGTQSNSKQHTCVAQALQHIVPPKQHPGGVAGLGWQVWGGKFGVAVLGGSFGVADLGWQFWGGSFGGGSFGWQFSPFNCAVTIPDHACQRQFNKLSKCTKGIARIHPIHTNPLPHGQTCSETSPAQSCGGIKWELGA